MKRKKIVKRAILTGMLLSTLISASAFAQSTNIAWSKETAQLYYTGHIEFKPNYTVPSNAGYDLSVGENVKQAYVNYTRDGKSVTTNGGRLYTGTASSKSQSTVYSAEAHAWDTLNPFANKTEFYYGWIYF